MMLSDKDIQHLQSILKKYEEGKSTPSESDFVEKYMDYLDELNKNNDPLSTLSDDEKLVFGEQLKAELLRSIHKENSEAVIKELAPERIYRFRWRIAAAILLTIIGTGVYWFASKQKVTTTQPIVQATPDIPPGNNRATLKLATGREIILDTVKGNIEENGDLKVNNGDGKLDYKGKATAVEYHTLSTPRGGDYQLQLPDGTKVWLNAASSITFPTVFNGSKRKVSITGEAYFEVVHDDKKPFEVETGKIIVKDLGTAFNINAYNDEPSVKTTLVEGSIELFSGSNTKILKPGAQGVVRYENNNITVGNVNVDEVIAWKNGLTIFNNEDIQTIMRQVSRWYDVDIIFKGNIPGRRFEGGISRKSNLSELLKVLEFQNINIVVEGRKIIVM